MPYLEMIALDANDDARKTGLTLDCGSMEEARREFEKLRPFSTEDQDGFQFLCDLHSDDGTIEDTLWFYKDGFEQASGHKALSSDEYIEIDSEFWTKVREYAAQRDRSKK